MPGMRRRPFVRFLLASSTLLLIFTPKTFLAQRQNTTHCGRRVPEVPREKLKLSPRPNSAWCDFISFTLTHMKAELFHNRANSKESDKVVLLIDDREHLGHFWTIPWTLNLLGPDWALQILTKERTVYFYQEIIEHYGLENTHIDTFEERYGYGPWVQEDFMRRVQFMLASPFWRGIRAEHILVIQDNGVPIRRWDHPEVQELFAEIMKYGYAGAPWNLDEGNRPGGNGGFSYRKRSVLSEAAVDLNVEFRSLLSNTTDLGALGADNEDAVLGNLLDAFDFGVAPKHLEHQFACEVLYQPKPFGVHHFAPRHSIEETTQIVQLALSELFCVNDSSQMLDLNEVSGNQDQWQLPWLELQKRFPRSILPFECLVEP